MLGMPLFAGQILASAIVCLAILIPVAIWGKGFLPSLIMGLLGLGFCTAIGWLPFWFLLILSMILALMFSGKIRDWITGGGT